MESAPRRAILRDRMQRSLRLDTIPEAIPVMLVIGRLVAIAFTVVAVKTFGRIKYRHYFDEIVTLKRESLSRKHAAGLFLYEMPITMFPYNLVVAFVLYNIYKRYNELIEGTINSMKALEELLGTKFEGLEELRKYKLSIIPVILAAYDAFFRFVFLAPILAYVDRKTKRGCQQVASYVYSGASAAIDKNVSVVIRNELNRLARGQDEVLRISKGLAVLTLLANVVISIPSAVRMHKIIRRVNKTIRVCRGTADSLASALVIVLRVFCSRRSSGALWL